MNLVDGRMFLIDGDVFILVHDPFIRLYNIKSCQCPSPTGFNLKTFAFLLVILVGICKLLLKNTVLYKSLYVLFITKP